MQIDLTIKNYRCFPDAHPARFSMCKGFTAFVGVNNSGKSSLLRFFYEFRNLFQILAQRGNFGEALQGRNVAFSLMPSIRDLEEPFSRAVDRDMEIDLAFPVSVGGGMRTAHFVVTIPRSTNTWRARFHIPDISGSLTGLNLQSGDIVLGGVQINVSSLFESCKTLADTLYIGPFRNAINVGGSTAYFDIHVGQPFIQAWRSYKTGTVVRQREAAYRLTDDIRQLFNFSKFDVNASQDEQTLQVLINDRTFNLLEVGAGLSQFILVLVSAAIKQPSFILIDEPELNLHPSLQLDFLMTLGSYAREGVVFSTHTIGLARATAERIYSFRKLADGESEVALYEKTTSLSQFLGELSFSGQREVGYDKVLLVEGVTDVLTMAQFLRKYKKDHLVVLLQLGGRGMITGSREAELEELKRISPNVSALIDSERVAEGASLSGSREAFLRSCERAGIKCHVLDRRSIENYLSHQAVKKVKGDKYRGLGPYEKLEEISPNWGKAENWRIALEMTREELEATDLGAFLASL